MVDSLLYMLKPVLDLIPTVRDPVSKVKYKDRILGTAITLFIYLICCQIPLYGVYKTSDADPLYYMRVILASNKGTLMELGISPLITSNMIVEFIANSKMIQYDGSVPTDRRLLQSAEKLLSIIVSFGTAFVYVFAGMYGSVQYIGTFKAFMIIVQLTFAAIMVIYLDEMLQKGYGIGSGISLFIATNICETLMWKTLSPVTIKTENGVEFEGALIALLHFLMTKKNKVTAFYLAFFRSHLTNLHNVVATLLIFFVVIFFQGFQVNLKLSSLRARGATSTYPVKLFYLSNTPIILQTALVSNLHIISNLLYKKFKNYSFIKLLGVWKQGNPGEPDRLIGGLAYYLMPPNSITDIIYNPSHFIIYMLFIVISCALFSKLWLELSGRSSTDILKQINDGDMKVANTGKSSSQIKKLNSHIPIAAVLGGIFIGVLSVVSDLIGTIGSGTGLLLVVNIIYGYFESHKKEKKNYISIRDAVEF